MIGDNPSKPDPTEPTGSATDADPFALPWSHVIVQFKADAEGCRELLPQIQVLGLDDPQLPLELPTGSGSCVLALGPGPMRAAGHLRGFGIEQVFGSHLPLGCNYLSQFLEERAAAVNYCGGSEHLEEVLGVWVQQAHLLDSTPIEHPDLPRPPRLKGRPFQELLSLPTPKHLIRACLAEQAVVVLGGASRSWKSFLVLDWHLSLYHGVQWRGMQVRPGSSVYFCGEGQAYAGRRVRAWLQHNAERIRGFDSSGRVFEIVGEVPGLSKPAGIADLRHYLRDFVKKHGPVQLVTLDTLSVGLSGDDDENNNATMGAIVAELGKIRGEFGCTVLLVHHLRKDTPSAGGEVTMASLRGGVALPCNVDQVFLVSVKGEEQTLRLDKNKDGEDDRDIARSAFQLVELGSDDEGLPITSGVLVPAAIDPEVTEEAEIAMLVKHYRQVFSAKEFTQSLAEQMKPTGMGRSKARHLIERARETGKLRYRLEGKTVLHSATEDLP